MGVICGHKRKLEDLPARPRQFNGLSASTLRGEWRPEWHKTFESQALCRRVVRRLRDRSPIVFALFPFPFSARWRGFPASGKRRSSPHRAARFQSQSRNRAKGSDSAALFAWIDAMAAAVQFHEVNLIGLSVGLGRHNDQRDIHIANISWGVVSGGDLAEHRPVGRITGKLKQRLGISAGEHRGISSLKLGDLSSWGVVHYVEDVRKHHASTRSGSQDGIGARTTLGDRAAKERGALQLIADPLQARTVHVPFNDADNDDGTLTRASAR